MGLCCRVPVTNDQIKVPQVKRPGYQPVLLAVMKVSEQLRGAVSADRLWAHTLVCFYVVWVFLADWVGCFRCSLWGDFLWV